MAHSDLMPDGEWRHVTLDGAPATVALSPRLTVNDTAAALAAAERDEGITPALS